jgi:digeranylgeranylglycerophospholipid reductase
MKFIISKYPESQSIRFTTGCVPSSLPLSECVKENVVAVGDAARQVNPFSGAGIANAFVAGRIAGILCGEVAFQNKPLAQLKQYDSLWRNEMEDKILRSMRLRKLFLDNDRNVEILCILAKMIPAFLLRKIARNLHY